MKSLTLMEVATLLIVLSALLSWINIKFFKLPHAVGLLLMGLMGSLTLIAADHYIPGVHFAAELHNAVVGIDFFDTVMNGMLASLLFAAALHVNVRALRSELVPILTLASIGVVISKLVIGFGLWYVGGLLGLGLPLVWALVFGALISPTDPVAVLSVLKSVKVPRNLEAKIAGESLFNDGIGVIVFTVLLAVAMATSGYGLDEHGAFVNTNGGMSVLAVVKLFSIEVFGAIATGTFAGLLFVRMIKGIDDAAVETLMSIALVLGTYVLCSTYHMSGPIAVVIAGLIVGNLGANVAMSERTKKRLFPFWEMADEVLNSVLFLLIGLEVIVLRIEAGHAYAALIAIPIVFFGRLISVFIPVQIMRSLGRKFSYGTVRIMTWGGVRGGISVALALSLPETEYKATLLTTTYIVVVFSIIVQGLTIAPVVRYVKERKPRGA
ncbi:sodium:proton antiporter [Rhizobium leguminosarum]|uniref:cation:proton antiporter n=1 Tax=Rhizobium leguminosarum TaxID=384 RepID=UPI002E15EAF0|nr:sodium:proton antiporter [Rhizobium leguminosarum]